MNSIAKILENIQRENRKYHEKMSLLEALKIARKDDAEGFSLEFLVPEESKTIDESCYPRKKKHVIYFDCTSKAWDENKAKILNMAEKIIVQDAAFHKENVRLLLEELREKPLKDKEI